MSVEALDVIYYRTCIKYHNDIHVHHCINELRNNN